MLRLIKTDKLDKIVDLLILVNFFVYSLSFFTVHLAIVSSFEFVGYVFVRAIKWTFIVSFILLAYKVLRGEYNLKELALYIVIGILLIISYMKYKDGMIILDVIYIALFKKENYKKVLKVLLVTFIIGYVTALLSMLFPSIIDASVMHMRYGALKKRFALGFKYVTFAPNFYLTLVILIILLKEKFNAVTYVILFIINLFLFILTDTKNIFICVLVVLILRYLFIDCKCEKIYCLFSKVSVIIFPLCAIFIFIISYIYDGKNEVLVFINKILTGRLNLNHNAILNYGIKLFGQTVDISTNAETYNYVDSSYISILVLNGLIPFIIVLIFFTALSYFAYKINYKLLTISLFIIAIHSTFDPQLIAIVFDPLIIIFYHSINSYNKSKLNTN